MDDDDAEHAFAKAMVALEARYRTQQALDADPLIIPKRFVDPMDQEWVAWVAAHLAYGKVAPMLKAIEAAIAPLGDQPVARLRSMDARKLQSRLEKRLCNWKWRFHTCQDVVAWMLVWKRLDEESGGQGIEPHLLPTDAATADVRLSQLVQRLRRELPPTLGIRFTLPDPLEGAACKRWRMFLRWMVRGAWPDLGIWKHYPVSDLQIPLDTHVARIAQRMGLTGRKTPDGKMACEITSALRKIDAFDPLKFDFALAHLGILGDCPGRQKIHLCSNCLLRRFCQ